MNVLAVGLCVALPAASPVLSTREGSLCDRFYDGTPEEQLRTADEIVGAARAELGLPKLGAGQALERSRKFFFMDHGVYTCEDDFMYQVVWKGANDFFSHNMRVKCNTSKHIYDDVPADGFLYSFARDPMSHFVSGYREATMRTFVDCCEPPRTEGELPTNKPKSSRGSCQPGEEHCHAHTCKYDCSLFAGEEGTVELAKAMIHDLLDLTLLNNFHFLHVSLMSANLFSKPRRPSFVGALENIEADWARMCETNPCPANMRSYTQDLDRNLGQHPDSSADKWHHGKGLKRALERDPRLERAVRKMLALDEDCLRNVTTATSSSRGRRALDVVLDPWLE